MLSILVLLAVLVSACGGAQVLTAPSTPTPTAPPSTLEEARAAWAAAGLTDYRYTVIYVCFCPEDYRGPYEVTVAGGTVTDVTPLDAAITAVPDDLIVGPVEALHDLIAEETATADEVTVTYDDLGVPVNAQFDRLETAIDDELSFEVTLLSSGGVADPTATPTPSG